MGIVYIKEPSQGKVTEGSIKRKIENITRREESLKRGNFVYSTNYFPEVGELEFIINNYKKSLGILQESVIDLFDQKIDIKPIKFNDIKLACSDRYFYLLYKKYKYGDEITRNHIKDELIGCSGSKRAVELAFKTNGVVYHLGGGYHHAAKFREGGFDYLNDIVYSIEYMRKNYNVKRFLVVDLDVHFPDGTYDTYVKDPNVYQLSMHGWNIFPGRGWVTDVGSGNAKFTKLNIPLPAGTYGSLYLKALKEFLPSFVEISNPEIVIYQAGVDVLHNDKLGNLKLTLEDVYERDKYVYELVKSYNLPLAILAGGGYSQNTPKAWANTASLVAQEKILFEEKLQIPRDYSLELKFEKWLNELRKIFEKFKKEREMFNY